MNPNWDNQGGGAGGDATDQEPDQSDPNEGGEGELSFSTQDYPELEGMKVGDPIKINCEAKVVNSDDGQISVSIDPGSCQFETQGPADKAMKDMSRQESMAPSPSTGAGEDF